MITKVAKKWYYFFGIQNEFNNFDKLKFKFSDFYQIKTMLKKNILNNKKYHDR